MTSTPAGRAGELGRGALDWLLAVAVPTDDGLMWTGDAAATRPDPTLYGGGSGIVTALLEGQRHFGDDRYGDAALRGAREIATVVPGWEHDGLYVGLAGMAFALHAVGSTLGADDLVATACHALARVRSRFDGVGWNEFFELLKGQSGIALAALALGDLALAELAVTPYLRLAEPTGAGVRWPFRIGDQRRLHHMSHGTLGIVHGLAATAHATGRADLLELALAGAADAVSRDEAGPDGFLVPRSDPAGRPAQAYSYGWCHGPAGDAQVFRLLGAITGDRAWSALGDRCWHTVTNSGLPRRLRPGFWDNNGRCCGTAGVLALACDRQVEQGDGLNFGAVLVEDLAARAIVDDSGARWSNHEHRATPSDLPPHQGWGMGNAGIARELLRYARISGGADPVYAVQWPDQPAGLSPPG